jgi:hypothetical protein
MIFHTRPAVSGVESGFGTLAMGIQPYEDFVLNAYLCLLLGILFRLPTLALSMEFSAVNPYPNNRHLWMR